MMRNPVVLSLSLAGRTLADQATLRGQDAVVQRGKYLVEEVGRCQECHTPKTDTGELDKAKWLKGAKLDVAYLKSLP